MASVTRMVGNGDLQVLVWAGGRLQLPQRRPWGGDEAPLRGEWDHVVRPPGPEADRRVVVDRVPDPGPPPAQPAGDRLD